MSLSDKIVPADAGDNGFYWEKDVKQFIKELKKAIKIGNNYISKNGVIWFDERIINKLAGDRLI